MLMPNRTITYLGAACGTLFLAYIALIAATMYFATLRTELTAQVRDLEPQIAALETRYYDAISVVAAANVADAGFVSPTRVEYVALGGAPTFTLAPTALGQ